MGLYFIDKEIKYLEDQLFETENRIRRGCGLGGFRSNGSVSDITGDTAIKIMEYSDEIDKKIKELYESKFAAERYIQTIGDPILRTVLRMRFLDFYSWGKIAYKIGSYNEATPRRMVDRFFEK